MSKIVIHHAEQDDAGLHVTRLAEVEDQPILDAKGEPTGESRTVVLRTIQLKTAITVPPAGTPKRGQQVAAVKQAINAARRDEAEKRSAIAAVEAELNQ